MNTRPNKELDLTNGRGSVGPFAGQFQRSADEAIQHTR